MKNMRLLRLPLVLALVLLGCDGQQYVSPDTARLTIQRTQSGSTLIEGCSYVPVLLGSQVQKRYFADDDLSATITLTRSDIFVTFEGAAGDGVEPFHVTTERLESGGKEAEFPPSGYTVDLGLGCTVDEP